MTTGRELLKKRDELLRYLSDKGAISFESSMHDDKIRAALHLEFREFKVVTHWLFKEELIEAYLTHATILGDPNWELAGNPNWEPPPSPYWLTREGIRAAQEAKVNEIEERKKQRFEFLKNVYQSTGGSLEQLVWDQEIGEELGFDLLFTRQIRSYLESKGLIKGVAATREIYITHAGVEEIEQALTEPNRPTEHFPAVNLYIGKVEGSQIQAGTAHSSQTMTSFQVDPETLTAILDDMDDIFEKVEFEREVRSDLEAQVNTLRAQMSSPRPNPTIIQGVLSVIRDLLVQAGGTALGPQVAALVAQLGPLLSG